MDPYAQIYADFFNVQPTDAALEYMFSTNLYDDYADISILFSQRIIVEVLASGDLSTIAKYNETYGLNDRSDNSIQIDGLTFGFRSLEGAQYKITNLYVESVFADLHKLTILYDVTNITGYSMEETKQRILYEIQRDSLLYNKNFFLIDRRNLLDTPFSVRQIRVIGVGSKVKQMTATN